MEKEIVSTVGEVLDAANGAEEVKTEEVKTKNKYKVRGADGVEKVIEMTEEEFKLFAGRSYFQEMRKQIAIRKRLIDKYAKRFGYTNLLEVGKMFDAKNDFVAIREEIAQKKSKMPSNMRKIFTELDETEFNNVCGLFSPEHTKQILENMKNNDAVEMMEKMSRVSEDGSVVVIDGSKPTDLSELPTEVSEPEVVLPEDIKPE